MGKQGTKTSREREKKENLDILLESVSRLKDESIRGEFLSKIVSSMIEPSEGGVEVSLTHDSYDHTPQDTKKQDSSSAARAKSKLTKASNVKLKASKPSTKINLKQPKAAIKSSKSKNSGKNLRAKPSKPKLEKLSRPSVELSNSGLSRNIS